jgi:hypothetical protein
MHLLLERILVIYIGVVINVVVIVSDDAPVKRCVGGRRSAA